MDDLTSCETCGMRWTSDSPHEMCPRCTCRDLRATMELLKREVVSLRRFKANIDEALNSGDGTYKP